MCIVLGIVLGVKYGNTGVYRGKYKGYVCTFQHRPLLLPQHLGVHLLHRQQRLLVQLRALKGARVGGVRLQHLRHADHILKLIRDRAFVYGVCLEVC